MFIKAKVFPNSKKQEIVEKAKDSFEIKVKEKPEKGAANKAAINILSLRLGVPAGKISLIKGARQKNKIFVIVNK